MNRLNTLKQSTIALAVAQAMVINVSSAATITVNDGGDAGAGCTFREAVVIVNAGSDQSNGCSIDISNGPLGSNDTIEFDVVGNSILLTAGEVLIDSDVSINPAGGAITIAGDRTDRLLNIESANVSIDNATLSESGFNFDLYSFEYTAGGAIAANLSTLTLNNSNISDNLTYFFYTGAGISAQSSTVTINNSSLSDNNANRGGSIYSQSSTITLNNSTISESYGNNGGGVFARSSNISLNNSAISVNTSQYRGGGIYATDQSTITLFNSDIVGNSILDATFLGDGDGGGIYVRDLSILTLIDSNVSGNLASANGGGIAASSSTVALTNSTISNNSSNGYSGGIDADSSLVILDSSTISGNSAASSGAIRTNSTSLNLVNSTISGNSASSSGGINTNLSWLNLTNSTISGNSTTVFGVGGIAARYGSVELRNSIISGNRGRADVNEISLNGVFLSASGNLIGDASQSLAQAIQTNQEFYQFIPLNFTNIIATYDGNTPTLLSNILRPLADNGGPTQTHALVEGSPAVNAGDNDVCTFIPVSGLDQRGETRPRLSCDIGAFEGALEPLIPDPEFFVVPLPNGKTVIFGL